MPFDPLTLIMLAVLALLVFFMFRNGRKRKRDQEELQSTIVAGADVMTNFGMYGTIVSIDEENNRAVLEIAPGVEITLHRQTIARVVDPVVDEPVVVDDADGGSLDAGEPEFGERTANELGDAPDDEPRKGDA